MKQFQIGDIVKNLRNDEIREVYKILKTDKQTFYMLGYSYIDEETKNKKMDFCGGEIADHLQLASKLETNRYLRDPCRAQKIERKISKAECVIITWDLYSLDNPRDFYEYVNYLLPKEYTGKVFYWESFSVFNCAIVGVWIPYSTQKLKERAVKKLLRLSGMKEEKIESLKFNYNKVDYPLDDYPVIKEDEDYYYINDYVEAK